MTTINEQLAEVLQGNPSPEDLASALWAAHPRGLSFEDADRTYREQAQLLSRWEASQPPLKKVVSLAGLDAASAAILLWRVVRQELSKDNQAPEWETFCLVPEDARDHVGCRNWMTCWESGPHEWGVYLSLTGRFDFGCCEVVGALDPSNSWFLETYWGFDVLFVER